MPPGNLYHPNRAESFATDVGRIFFHLLSPSQENDLRSRRGLPPCLGASAKPKPDGRPQRGAGAARAGSHGPVGQAAFSEPGRPPYDARGRDSLILSHATGADFSGSQFVPDETYRIFPARKTAPSFSTDGYPAGNL